MTALTGEHERRLRRRAWRLVREGNCEHTIDEKAENCLARNRFAERN